MANPLDEALMSKEAFLGAFFRGAASGLRGSSDTFQRAGSLGKDFGISFAEGIGRGGHDVGKLLPLGVGGAALAGVGAGIGAGVNKLLGAAAKRRDFKEMMELNPDLLEHHKDHPEFFNASYSAIRRVAPQYGEDPVVAGSLMRRMMANPDAAGTILTGVVKPPQVRDGESALGVSGELGPLKYKYSL